MMWLKLLLLMFLHMCKSATGSNFSKSTPASDQLQYYARNNEKATIVLSSSGAPVDALTESLSIGENGPLLIQDTLFFEQLQSLNRERISPRVVHSKGPGAFGYLKITHDISKYSKANVFSKAGKRIPLVVRFSRVGGDVGSSDTYRDTRGFATKIYTDEGIWDLVCNNSPVFFVRDPLRFPSLIHSTMRNPVTHLIDANAMWDYATLTPEAIYQTMFVFSDYGIPASFRNIDGFAVHAFELVNATGAVAYAKFHLRSNQGLKFLSVARANFLASSEPDYYIKDLYNNIANGNSPSWNFSVQIVTQEQLSSFPWNPFDPTKVWSLERYPEIPVGQIFLDRNPSNYFVDVENLGFSPGNLVPGIQPSLDKLLQGRLFAYRDAQLYRLGVNAELLKVNSPLQTIHNYQRDGAAHCGSNQGSAVNYYPNSFNGPVISQKSKFAPYTVHGNVSRYKTENEDNYSQPAIFYQEVLTSQQRANLVANLVSSLSGTYQNIQERAVKIFSQVSRDLGSRIKTGLAQAAINAAYLSPNA